MPYYRITWDGYIEGEYPDGDEAKNALIKHIEEDELDQYLRNWRDLVSVEELGSG